MPHGKRIAELLLNIDAVRLSVDPPFTWTNGIKSPIYCDNRMLYSHPDARDFVVKALTERVKALHIEPDAIAGTATAGIGWATLVADRLGLPMVYVRAKAKKHGSKKAIEGDLKKGSHVVVIEDLISTGGSAVSTVEKLREEGECSVTDVVAIFSYELVKSLELAQQASVKLHPLSDFGTLLQVAAEQGRLIPEDVELAKEFANNPENWGS